MSASSASRASCCVRVTSAWSSCIAIVVYRTGPVTSAFFTELSDVLDRVSTFNDPILVVGNVNIHLTTRLPQFTDTLAAHSLACHVTVATHDQVGLLDVVATRDDLTSSPPAAAACRSCRRWSFATPAAAVDHVAYQAVSGQHDADKSAVASS